MLGVETFLRYVPICPKDVAWGCDVNVAGANYGFVVSLQCVKVRGGFVYGEVRHFFYKEGRARQFCHCGFVGRDLGVLTMGLVGGDLVGTHRAVFFNDSYVVRPRGAGRAGRAGEKVLYLRFLCLYGGLCELWCFLMWGGEYVRRGGG